MFTGKTVVVTGAAQGIGNSIARMYASQHANLVLADMNPLGSKVADEIGNNAIFVQTDVRRPEQIIKLMKKAVEYYGKIDVLINNAGIFSPVTPYESTVDEWDDVINTNLRSVFLCSREAAKYMKENENGGRIVSMASTRAFMSEPNTESYAATKGGIIALTHALARSLGPDGINVNCISPGWIETGDYNALSESDHSQHLARRVGKPEDIARACLYLTHPLNDFITGQNITVDGGMTKKMIYED
ncbi:SDR family NAD(P)-dependent oxidoreductase [Rummeliibacillus sp. JY-2-4R]